MLIRPVKIYNVIQESVTYNVIENDIALLNVFFGESMVLGKYESQKVFGNSVSEYERSLKRTTIEILVDMAAWFGEKSIFFLFTVCHREVLRGLFGHQCSISG